MRSISRFSVITLIAAMLAPVAPHGACLYAQENYEIQVYPSETVPRGVTMFELHSNYTLLGSRQTSDIGERATNHAVHETLEITHGINDWSELGFYWFTSIPQGQNWQWVGTHIRPRVRVPDSWGWPVGVSISQEVGYSQARFSGDTWTYELRPIIDKTIGRWYISFNPTFDKSLRGPTAAEPFVFAPNVNLGYDVTKKVNLAVEYYGATGPLNRFDPIGEQEHDLYGVVNLDLGPAWEFNFGYGTALTAGGDKHLVKMILGRRVGK
ncbi:MAG TPA: hypothetical protein VGM50_11750 [Gemmatimonadaceae bacterium]|jgi:hypothetical protein